MTDDSVDPDNTSEKQDARFQPGQSGNPNGRPQGSRNKATLAIESLMEGEGEAITRKAIEKALEGDMAAIRLCLERLCPPRKDNPVSFELAPINSADDALKALAAVLDSVAQSGMTPEEAKGVAGLIETYRRTMETTELERRIAALEGK